MSKNLSRVHIDCDEENTDFIGRIRQQTGWSNLYIGNKLLSMIKSAEITIEATIAKGSELSSRIGGQPVKFKNKIRMQIKIER